MKLMKPAIFLAACLLLQAGCSKSANTSNTTSNVSTTTTKNSATTTTATPSSQATAQPSASPEQSDHAKAATPEEAAKGLIAAFGKHDREGAAKYASAEAVAKLFKESTGTEGLQFQGCNDEKDKLNCAYSYEGGGLILYIKGSKSEGYQVDHLEFIAD